METLALSIYQATSTMMPDIVNYITNNLQIKDLTLVGTEDECIHDEQGMGGI